MIDRRVLVQGGSAWGVCHQVGCVLALYGLLVLYGSLVLVRIAGAVPGGQFLQFAGRFTA